MPLDVGLMDREIVLQTATRSKDPDNGQEILTWPEAEDVDGNETIFAEWLAGDTSESARAQKRIESYIDGVYKIHYRDEPRPDINRVIGHDGRTYDLKPAIEIGRGEGWMLPVVARGE
jgi:hypothetical protein